MKKRFFSLLIFLIICGVMPAASAESVALDGFSITFPDNFVAELKATEPEAGSDFFTPASAYQAESVYELLTVKVGSNDGLDAVFNSDFGFARREDLDLSLLTEDQLHAEAERFTEYLDSAYPVYMTYQSPKSIEADGRLGLVVTGYYTDYNNALTGQFRAYEFYYLNKTIIIYYDTQIEGTYFNEAVFELSDGIVSSMDFEIDPLSQPMNANWFSGALDMAVPVLTALIIALILGFLFSKIKRAPRPERVDEPAGALEPAAPEAAPASIKAAQPVTAPAPKPEPAVKPPQPVLAEDTEDEAVDWQSMLAKLKQQAAGEPDEPEPETMPDTQEETQKQAIEAESAPEKPDEDGDNARHLNDNIEASFKEIGRLAAMVKEKLHLGKPEKDAQENSASEPAEETAAADTDYKSYLEKLLPKKRFKPKAADENIQPEEKPAAPDSVPAVSEPKPAKATPENSAEQPDTPTASEEAKKEGGFFSRALSKIVKRIETSDDVPDPAIPEFESRIEMHISEKTEQNPIDKLMPGLFDDDPEEEQIEVVLDEDMDALAELGESETVSEESEEPAPKKRGRLRGLFNKKPKDDAPDQS